MKNITLRARDIYDLTSIFTNILNEKSGELDFPDIVAVQKSIREFRDANKAYHAKADGILEQRLEHLKAAQEKVKVLQSKLPKDLKEDKSGKKKEELDKKISDVNEGYMRTINDEILPLFNKLEDGDGVTMVDLEIADGKHKSLLTVFEKFSKEHYKSMEVMVNVHDALNGEVKVEDKEDKK